MPIISESSSESNRTPGGNHYHHRHHANRYHVLARNIDVTLAEIDMETFTSEDINHIYSTLPELDSSCSGADTPGGGTVTEDGGEEFASVTGSLLDEIHSDSHYLSSKRFNNSHGIDLNGSSSIFDSSLIVDETSVKTLSSIGCGSGGTLTMRSDRLPGLYERSHHLEVSGVSADSLDFSSSENDNNTNEMILRCREQDKTKYTIAFEESVSSVTTFSDSADDTKNNSEESDAVTHYNHHHHNHHPTHRYCNSNPINNHQQRRRRMNGVNFISVNNNDRDDYDLDDDYHRHCGSNGLVKSEYTTWNMVKRRGPIGRRDFIKLRNSPFRTIAKQSQSLPNIVQVTSVLTGDHGEPLFPPLGSYVPLYDLNKSNTTTNSSNSEVSPPRSLIRLFIKNRNSPTSSSPGSSSTSFEGHLIESSELNHGHHNHHHSHHLNGQQQQQQTGIVGGSKVFPRSGGNVGSGPTCQYYFGDKEGYLRLNSNNSSNNRNNKRSVGQQCQTTDWSNFEDSLVTEETHGNESGLGGGGGHVTLLPPKTGFNRLKQASPIREEDIALHGDGAIASGTDESYYGKDGTKSNNSHWPNYHFDKFKNNTGNGNGNTDRVNIIGTRRSISVDRFMPTQCTGTGCNGDINGRTGLTPNGGCGSGTSSNNQNAIRRSSDYGSSNMNKIRFSSGREFGSVSSGYLSSRQGSSEWHRKTIMTPHCPPQHHQQQQLGQPKPSSSSSSLPHQYMLGPSSSSSTIPSNNKRYSISVTTMKTAATQVPVHIQDKQVQTATSSTATQMGAKDENDKSSGNGGEGYPMTGFIIREHPTNTVRDQSIPLSSCYAKETFSPPSDYDNSHHPKHYHPNYELEEDQQQQQRAKPLYVCFPNYSLPDLSFLRTLSCPCTPKDEGPSAVYLSPTKLKLPLREFQSNATSSGLRRPLGRAKGIRPKSCTDYENLIANRSFNHIKDWDSLKVLLPNEFKSLISKLEGGGDNKNQTESHRTTSSNVPSENYPGSSKDAGQSDERSRINNTNPFSSNYKEPKTSKTTFSSPASEVKLRPRKRSVVQNSDSGFPSSSGIDGGGGCGCQHERKRHSLQEPPSDYGYHQQPYQHQHHIQTADAMNCTYRNTISRSVTMPSCVYHNQQQPICYSNCCQPRDYYHHHHQQHQPHHFHPYDHHHQQLCLHHQPHQHSHGNQKASPTVNSCCQGGVGCGSGGNGSVGGKSSMSSNVKSNEMNNSLVNNLFDDPSVDRLCHLLSKGISVKDFTNIIGGGNGSSNGTVKNRLTSPSKPYEPIKEQVNEETESIEMSSSPYANDGSLKDQQQQPRQLTNKKQGDESNLNSSFNVIKKRWESLASPVSSAINLTSEPVISSTGTKGKSTPPPSAPSTTPLSNNYSPPPTSSSSTSSSNTTAALPVKPKVPIKPQLSSLRPTSVPLAKRPTTLGANNTNVFKSMIPIAKGSKSPPSTVKQLTSPISKTLPRSNSKKTNNKTT